MIRYQVRHDRDRQTKPGFHWNVYESDTDDPKAKPTCVGWGSHEACLAYAIGLVELRAATGVRP